MQQSSGLQLVVVALLAVATLTTSMSTSESPSLSMPQSTELLSTQLGTSISPTSESPMCDVNNCSLVHDESKRTEHALTFNWTLAPESEVYSCNVTICIIPEHDTCQTLPTDVSSGSVTFRHLIPGTTYNATLSVSDDSIVITAASAVGTTYLVPPTSPIVDNVTETTITVSWTSPNATYDCVILNCMGINGDTSDSVNITNTYHTGTCVGLTPGALYNITLSTTLNNNSAPPATTDIFQNVTLPNAPSSVTATTENSETIQVAIYKAEGQVNYYLVNRNPPGIYNENVSCTGDVTTTTIDGLTGGTLYNISVRSCSFGVCSTNASTASNTTYTNAPANVQVVGVDETSITVTWDKAEGRVDKYTLKCNDQETQVTNTTATCVNLTAGDSYEVMVCSSIESAEPRENCTSHEDVTTVPYGPQGIVLAERNTTALTLNVSGPQLETVFDEYFVCVVEQDISPEPCPDNATEPYPAPDDLIVIAELNAGTTYYIEVYTASGGVHSNQWVNTTETTLLNPPTNITVTVIGQAINSSWRTPEGNSEAVTLYCVGLENAVDKSVRVNSEKQTATCSGLTAGALYDVILESSLNRSGLAPARNSTDVKSVVTEPRSPDGVILETVSTSAIYVTVQYNYNETTGQCSYFSIQYTGNGTDSSPDERNITCNNKSTVLSSLESNTLYVVSVSAFSKFNGSVLPRESSLTSNTSWTLPEQVSELEVVSKGSRWFLTNWTEVANPENVGLYVLRVSNNGVCQQQIPLSVSGSVEVTPDDCNKTCVTHHATTAFNATGYNVTDLTPYSNYEISVTAVNPGGCGQDSEEYSITTEEDIPGVVELQYLKPDNVSLNATWSRPKEPNGIIYNYTIRWCQLNRVAEGYPLSGAEKCENHTTRDNKTTYTINELDPYTNYSVSVAASTVIGRGEFVEVINATLTGVPYPAINVTASPLGYNAIDVVWSVPESAYPTGPLMGYNVTATPLNNYTNVSMQFENTTGFESYETQVDNLDPYVIFTVCVQAYAIDYNNEVFWSSVSDPCDRVQTEEGAPAAVTGIDAPVDSICDSMTISWNPPSPANGILQEYRIELVKLADNSSIVKNVSHKENQHRQSCTVEVDPNNQNYTISIQAKTNYYKYGPSSSITQTSGLCSPTSVDPKNVITNPMKKSKTTFDVELTRCSLCHNSNGDITFVGLIITEYLELENKEYNYGSEDELGEVFGSWDSYNATLGYRTTPNDWNKMIDCNISCADRGAAGRYRRETRNDKYTYTVGASGDCDGYCNHKLDDSKNARQFKVRLVLGTAGGIIVMKMSDDIFELKPNKAWIAAPVIVCLVVVAVVVIIVVVMQRRRLGPFKENRNSTRTVQFPPGTTNPAFIDDPATERPSPVKVSDFEDYVAQRSSDSEMMFSEEYKLIQDLSPKHPYTHAELPNNRLKNRFVNILPFDHSRVKLQAADDDDSSDYINANYMPGYNSKREFIASQGPMKSTVDDFWRMIWEQNVPLIVMLTQLEERGRERCAKYWPSDNEPMFYGELQVTMRSESVLDSYVIRIFDIQLGDKKRSIKQMHFIRWPDFGVPENAEMLLDFVNDVRIHLPHELKGPILVHCSAGVGRTGSFIAIDRLLQHIKHHDTLDIFSVVLEMRNYRLYMIQVEPQYILVHKCILAAIRRGLHQGPEHIYDNCVENIYENA